MPISLLTDFGTTDYYVAAVRATLLRLAPDATLVDVSHDVAPGDVEGAAWLLAAAARWFGAGTVHYAVVDPGVGSARRILAARAGGAFLVAPDNGLLTPFLDGAPACYEDYRSGGSPPLELRAVERSDLFLPGPGATFHGRDRFAPVAAWLARGEALAELGPPADDPVRLDIEPPRRDGDVLHGRVAHVDRFGNLVTDLPTEWLGNAGCEVRIGGHATSLVVDHFAQLPPGRPGALPGSLGTLELSLDGASLAALWGVERGDRMVARRKLPTPTGEDGAGTR